MNYGNKIQSNNGFTFDAAILAFDRADSIESDIARTTPRRLCPDISGFPNNLIF